MKHLLLLLLFLTTSFTASSQETHVFLLAGQSNMVGRPTFDGGLPHPAGTLQWGRFGGSNNTLIPASIPLQQHDASAGDMGLDVQFAIDYIAANPTVTLVLIPSAKGGTGFNTSGEWRVGDALYNDAVNRANACMAANPSFIFKGILWHQGERDRNNIPAYYTYYDDLINSMRNDINAADDTTPFICGGIMPDFISNNAGSSDIELVQAYIEDTPNRIQHTAYADNTGLTTFDNTHGDAASLRVFGTRYFQQLTNAVNNAVCNVDLINDGFEGGFGNWNDGGSDCARSTSNPNTGVYSARLRDNSGVGSSMYTDLIDLSAYNEVIFEFSYYPSSMENGEDFFLEISTNGGSSYATYQTWASGTDFSNNNRYDESVTISGISFTNNTVVRLRCDASGNNDYIYVDDVVIKACIETCTTGTSCDDGDPCTINDVYDQNCDCVGTPGPDSDGDGVCDAIDQCPGLNDALIGTTCDDGDDCTSNDIYTTSCNCEGTPEPDTDGDGLCDSIDSCPNLDNALIGTPCDDADLCTLNDIYNVDCNCYGTPAPDNDGDGYCSAEDPNDNDPCIPDTGAPGCTQCGDIINDGFESGFGNWNDGGNDCVRTKSYPNSGNYSIRLRDNSGSSSSITSDILDMSSFNQVLFNFSYYPVSMENGEDFFLEISTNGGSSYATYQTWASGTDFSNNNRYDESVTISGISFTANTIFRLRCDASGNNDQVYIDDVVITDCISQAPKLLNNDLGNTMHKSLIRLYPNPTSNILYVEYSGLDVNDTSIKLYTILGQVIRDIQLNPNNSLLEINLDGLSDGVYMVKIINENGKILKTDRIIYKSE